MPFQHLFQGIDKYQSWSFSVCLALLGDNNIQYFWNNKSDGDTTKIVRTLMWSKRDDVKVLVINLQIKEFTTSQEDIEKHVMSVEEVAMGFIRVAKWGYVSTNPSTYWGFF